MDRDEQVRVGGVDWWEGGGTWLLMIVLWLVENAFRDEWRDLRGRHGSNDRYAPT